LLVIRKAQLSALSKAKEHCFYRDIASLLKANQLEALCDASDEELTAIVLTIADRAKSYGFTSAGQLKAFFKLVCLQGLEFDLDETNNAARNLLLSTSKHGSEKIVDLMALFDIEEIQ